ncbi:MAG: carbonic anhydrase [Bacteroidia bacterium]
MKNLFFLFIFFGFLNVFNQEKPINLNPLERLERGNKRFVDGKPSHPNETAFRIRQLKDGQRPFVIVVSCSDSRVPPELVFDQGFGDIFSVRTAGQVISDLELGSIEYAVEHLECSLVVVMGHTHCGAVSAFVESKGDYKLLDHLRSVMDYMGNEVEEKRLIASDSFNLEKAIDANIFHVVQLLRSSTPVLSSHYYSKKVQIIGALYDIETGIVKFYK